MPISTLIDVDAKFVLEVASGIREPAEIAEEYGYTPDQWLSLQAYQPFVKAVDAKKQELQASGYTFKMKAAVAAEDLLGDVYLKAKEDNTSFHTQLEALKFMARAAGLDAPMKEERDIGTGFSITINLGGGQTVQIGKAGSPSEPGYDENTIDVEEEYDFSMAFDKYHPAPLP